MQPALLILPDTKSVSNTMLPFWNSRRQQKRIKMLRQRRLAGTVMSQDRNKFARLHRKIYILYRWNLSLHIGRLYSSGKWLQ